MLINSGLDQFKISPMNGPFPDSNGQHSHCITEEMRGRQQKVKEGKENFVMGIWLATGQVPGLK